MKKTMFLSKDWYFSVQKALIYYTFNKSHHNSFILLVFSHVANFRYVANFRFLTLYHKLRITDNNELINVGWNSLLKTMYEISCVVIILMAENGWLGLKTTVSKKRLF